MSRLGGTLPYIISRSPEIPRELNNENTVLRAERNEQNYTYLRVYAHRNSGNPATDDSSQQCHRHTHYSCHGACPALVLCGKHQISHKQCNGKYCGGVLARTLFLIGNTCPFVPELLAKLCAEQLLNLLHHFARTVPLGRVRSNRRAVVHVVAYKLVASQYLLRCYETAERHHLSILVGKAQLHNILNKLLAAFACSHFYLPYPAEQNEVIDIHGSHVVAQGRQYISNVQPH